jgi:RNA-directed DNA polymerase
MTTSNLLPTPPGGDRTAGVVPRALNQDEGMKTTTTTDLLDAALASDNLRRAWARVKANRGAPGIDGVSCEDFPAWSRVHWPALRQQIESGRYQPQPVRRVEIPKPSGGTRLLGIPTVMGTS